MKEGKYVNLPGLASLVAALVLTGCATRAPTTERVEIPVFTPCVKTDIPKPDYEFDKLPATASDGEKVIALARDWLAGRKYEGELEAAIAGCK